MTKPSSLTPTALAGHLACPHLTQLERRRRGGERIPIHVDPRLEALQQRGRAHEDSYVVRLRAEGRSVADLRGARDVAATRTAMQAGFGAILQAPLDDGVFFGIADVLLRAETPSALGAWSYQPVDTKLARDTKAGTILQLCAYCDLLAPLQGAAPATFRVVTPRADEPYMTADFAAYHRLVRARLLAATQVEPAPTTYPEPVPHCEVCGFWKVCADQRRADDHPSLIAGVHRTHVREMQCQAITTLSAFAECDGMLPRPPRQGTSATLAKLGLQAKLQVQARSQPLPPVETLLVELHKGLARLPEPSAGDVFLDFEGDPFVGDHGLEYLTGWCVADDTGVLRYHSRWALDAAAEKAATESFLDEVAARLAQQPDLHVYHFGAYEPAALKRLCARHDTRGEVLDTLLRGHRFVDLHAVVREGLRIGVERYGLKELEALHAFVRTLDLRDAGIARRDLELALEAGDPAAIDAALRTQVADYNREDCESTASLRGWLERQRATLVANGVTVPRPQPSTGEPSKAVGERDAAIAALQEALLTNLPDPNERDDAQRAQALLASMLGYFRQEEKNAWWTHFTLRDKPADERLDEREMLADLEFVGVEPKAPRQRNVRHRYRFPAQDTAVVAGKNVFFLAAEDPAEAGGSTSMQVESLDLDTRTAVLSMNARAATRHPTAVFREQVVEAKALETSLLAFATHVREHGLGDTRAFSAARDLLLRRPPRLRGDIDPSLRRAGETTLASLQRLCAQLDGGVLAVQGPPGTGKTYSGARAIVALVAAGKTVGVTAVSHKVIDNLLAAVHAAALEAAVPVHLVHKDHDGTTRGVEYVATSDLALGAIAPGAVIGGTAWLWAADAAASRLDYLFIDEAGQMALAQALAAARAATNLVLLGDPQQLDQPTRGAHPDGADVAALVHVIGERRATVDDRQGLFLDRTFRLHPTLCAFTSQVYYDGRLTPDDADVTRRRLLGDHRFAGAGLFLVEVAHEGNQADAPEEAEAVTRIVAELLGAGTRWADKHGQERELVADDILVIAPYNAQVDRLRRRLDGTGITRVGTVDKFQGQEAPVVIYSCTSSSPLDAPRGMAFLYDPHRFNVATSRAEGVVIVVANPHLFEPECRTPTQMRWANGLCRYRELAHHPVG